MAINVKSFNKLNVIDTCSIWNIISSLRLNGLVEDNGLFLSCTAFVLYEALFKKRKKPSKEDDILRERLRRIMLNQKLPSYNITIDDLQNVDILENRMKLSKGELSSIVFANKTRQAFLTDDQKARILASYMLQQENIQTVPHLIGWLTFQGIITEFELEEIVSDHKRLRRPLEKYLREAYEMGRSEKERM